MITMSEEDAKKTLDALYAATVDPKELISKIERQKDEIERLREGLNGREPLRWFAEQMEQTLKANDHKGGWEDIDSYDLWRRAEEELGELFHALFVGDHEPNADKIIREATDVANFAMMIADNARRALKGVNNE